MSTYPVSTLNRVRRLPKRAAYDQETIHAILDSAFLCHVGFVIGESPVVIPTSFARDGDSLILHGSAASRMLHSLAEGVRACVTVTIVDGFVLARSAFHHSINYRSAVLFGTASLVDDPNEKWSALERFMEHLTPGRWEEARKPAPNELKGTSVIRFEIEEASAKVRTGGPVDDEVDQDLAAWAGVIPLAQSTGEPEPAGDLRSGIAVSEAVRRTKERWSFDS